MNEFDELNDLIDEIRSCLGDVLMQTQGKPDVEAAVRLKLAELTTIQEELVIEGLQRSPETLGKLTDLIDEVIATIRSEIDNTSIARVLKLKRQLDEKSRQDQNELKIKGTFSRVKYSDTFASLDVEPPAITFDAQTVGILFATTRKPMPPDSCKFSDERVNELSFGAAAVRVPENRQIGEVNRPFQIRIPFFGWTLYRAAEDPNSHFVITELGRLNRKQFIDTIGAGGKQQALIFVHGFNVIFEDGLYSLAQIAWDTQFMSIGIPILFSWPAKGRERSYFYDQKSAEFSRGAFIELLKLLQSETSISAIHVVAHSMGNEIVVDALANLGASQLKKPLAEIVLAAPDVDRDIFTNIAGRIKQVARGVTLYASSADKALVISRGLAEKPRAGDIPEDGPVVLADIETIDVTALGESPFGLNHSTYARERSVIDDLGRLLSKGDRPPHLRSPQIRRVPEDTQPPQYWRYPK